MKKRILSGLFVLLICLGLLAASVALGAPSNPCFMAVNDTLLLLEDQFIPIAVNGQYYVPYNALDSGVTGVELGINPIYNTTLNTLTIYKWEQELIFDLTAGTCTDRSGVSHSVRAVTRNGQIYVPVRFTCEYFGLTYSSRVTTYGPMVRIRSSSSTYDDNEFVSAAQQRMEERLRDWRKAQSETATSTPAPIPTPTPTPAPTPTPPETDKSDVHVYLAFRADQTEGLEDLLDRLEYYQINALFFFPAAELADYDAAVRSVLCGGHGIGFLVSGITAEEISGQVTEGNRLLTQIVHMNTYTILAPDVSAETEYEQIEAAGLLCWNTDLDAQPDGRTASQQASTVLGNADRYSSEVYILSDASAAGAALIGRLLPEMVRERYALRLAVETEI